MDIEILVDADACPVKAEIYRVAERYGVPVTLVANSYMAIPRDPRVRLEVVGSGFDEFLPIQENQGFFGQEVDQAGGKSVKIRDL